jgi:uncharacterized membrane protein YfcA
VLAFFSGLPVLPPISIGEYGLLLAMAFIGGVMNSVAGGGSFFAFPALLAVHLPPSTPTRPVVLPCGRDRLPA